jgi:CBS domain containing-hemolysin-like protein
MILSIAIIILTLIFSAFFSGMEIAFISSNKLKLELDKKQGGIFSQIIKVFTKTSGQFVATMLIGNNISLVIYGILMASILDVYIKTIITNEILVLTIQTIISTIIIIFTAEYLPKALFRINPNKSIKLFSIPMFVMYIIIYPITKITMLFSDTALKYILKVKPSEKNKNLVFGKTDINDLVEHLNHSEDEDDINNDIKLFQNALDFSEVKIRECIVPRTEIVAVDIKETKVDELLQKFIETGYSKILVYNENIDNIIGYIHNSDLFKNPTQISSIVRKIKIVPETMSANKLLSEFSKDRLSLAVVVDEFGGTSGIVTFEDIMEEIFGEIEDEHDKLGYIEKIISETEFVFSGRLEIDYIREKYNIEIPVSPEYETLAGYILLKYENIPKLNDIIKLDNFSIKILEVSNTKIKLVNLRID